MHYRQFVTPLDGRKRKLVVWVPRFTQVLVEPPWFRLKIRITRDGFAFHFQKYPNNTRLWRGARRCTPLDQIATALLDWLCVRTVLIGRPTLYQVTLYYEPATR